MAVSLYHAGSKIQIEKEKLSAASDTPRTHPSRENASRAWKKRKPIWIVGTPAAPGTVPLLPARPTGRASRRLCRSRGRLLWPTPGLDRTLGPSAVGRTLRSHPRSQQRSAAAGTCAPETRLVSHQKRRPPETQTAACLSVTVARRPRRHSHRHTLQPYL